MITLIAFIALLALAGLAAAGDLPALDDRADDTASLAAFLKDKAGPTAEAFKKALDASGKNREHFEKALELCGTRREKLVMVWLVSNMDGKSFAKLDGREWKRISDLETMTADHIFHNVRYALAARDRFPWCRDLPWDMFLKFVLPYRNSQEKAEDYRPVLWDLLLPAVEGAADARAAILAVNEFAASRVSFKKREPQDLGALETLNAGSGRYEDMANFVIACAATIGIPCTSAFTPWWAKSDGNHAWNEVWISGKWRSFMGCEPVKDGEPFDRIKEKSVFAKVFRKRFCRFEGGDEIYGEDVTAEYTKVADVAIMGLLPDSGPCRLAVYNSGGWRVTAVSKVDSGGKAVFRNVGCLEPVLYSAWLAGNEAQPACPPFILAPDGSREFFAVDMIEPGTIGLRDLKIGSLLPNSNAGIAHFNGRQWMLLARATVGVAGEADFGKTGRGSTLYVMVRIYGERLVPQGRPFSVKYDGDKAIVTRH